MIGLWIEHERYTDTGKRNPNAGRRWFKRPHWAKQYGLGVTYSVWVPEELASLFCGYEKIERGKK